MKQTEMLDRLEQQRAEKIFNLKNNEHTVGTFIDLHGQTSGFALRITKQRLDLTQELLDSGSLCPNTENKRDHLWKIVCGKGNHSQDKIGKLKYRVADWLESERIEHCADLDGGVFLVRLTKRQQQYKKD